MLSKSTTTMTTTTTGTPNANNDHFVDASSTTTVIVTAQSHHHSSSTISRFSADSFKARFEWLFLPSSNNNNNNTLSEQEWKDKEDAIRRTLQGSSDNSDNNGGGIVVDLWRLRELALSPGGLLCPELRKRAWPKLVSCHEQVLKLAAETSTTATNSTKKNRARPMLVTPDAADLDALAHDVSKTIWNIEEHLQASKEQQKMQEEKLQQILLSQKQQRQQQQRGGYKKQVSFAPLLVVNTTTAVAAADPSSSSNHHIRATYTPSTTNGGGAHIAISTPTVTMKADAVSNNNNNAVMVTSSSSSPTLPDTVATSPSSNEDDDDDEEEGSILSHGGDHVLSSHDASAFSHNNEEEKEEEDDDMTMGTFSPRSDTTTLTQETGFTLSSRVVPWRKASIQEQKILYNIILSILRTPEPQQQGESYSYFEDDRYHYFQGLQDLTALLMINLESPSITSLVLTKLAESHLRDAFRGLNNNSNNNVLETALLAFMPLLEAVDKGLYEHLHKIGMTLPSFCKKWIVCWFAQDVPDAETASRLLDVFLVSHPLMPLYMAVAWLTVHRNHVLNNNNNCNGDDSNSNSDLSTLYAVLRGLPMKTTMTTTTSLDDEERVDHQVENVISTAISYMNKLPPYVLVQMVQNAATDASTRAILPAVAMFQEAPDWSRLAQAPNDWALLQRAKALRTTQEDKAETTDTNAFVSTIVSQQVDEQEYPLAATAIGSMTSSSSSSWWWKSRVHLLGIVFGMLVVFLVVTSSQTTSGLITMTTPPSWSKLPAKRTRTTVFPNTINNSKKNTRLPEPKFVEQEIGIVAIKQEHQPFTTRLRLSLSAKNGHHYSKTSSRGNKTKFSNAVATAAVLPKSLYFMIVSSFPSIVLVLKSLLTYIRLQWNKWQRQMRGFWEEACREYLE